MRIQQLQSFVDLTTMYLSVCKKQSHKLAHYFSHMKTFYEDHFSLLSKALFFSYFLLFFSSVLCYECLLMVVFIGKVSERCLTCMKTHVLCLPCKVPSVPYKACTIQVLLVHYTMSTPFTLLLVIRHNLPFCKMYVGHEAMGGPHVSPPLAIQEWPWLVWGYCHSSNLFAKLYLLFR